tara:strand:+ start:141 stop:809 length:669 start_codon:yes stop_codon:yes gene_type:complete
MKEYIRNKTKNTTRFFKFGGIDVEEFDKMPDNVNMDAVFKAVENNLPSHYFRDIEKVKIGNFKEFEDRGINALYRDNTLMVTSKQDNTQDLLDDIVHEIAHHVETLYPEVIYSSRSIINEFIKKRHELEFELKSEGYWTKDYDFDNLKYDQKFDSFLYDRVGKNTLKMLTHGSFVRPYASVSLREYFATGFEYYYLGKQDILEKISPMLYDKIDELHNLTEY